MQFSESVLYSGKNFKKLNVSNLYYRGSKCTCHQFAIIFLWLVGIHTSGALLCVHKFSYVVKLLTIKVIQRNRQEFSSYIYYQVAS
jgi:hypothetical protein